MAVTPDRLLALFRRAPGRPLAMREITDLLGAAPSQRRVVRAALRALAGEGKIVSLGRGRYTLLKEAPTGSGRVQVSAQGHGFLIDAATGGGDVYIHRSNLDTALDGDRVEAEVFPGTRGREEGRVLRVVQRAHETIVGQLKRTGSTGIVTPRNVRLQRWIELRKMPPKADAPDGAWVMVRVRRWSASRDEPLMGDVEEIVGLPGERGLPVLVLLRDMGIDPEFPAAVKRQAAHFHPPPHAGEVARRLDLRDRAIFTIDPATAKDHDDAISVERLDSGGWRLGVHIADVAQYVRADTPLDAEALERATSIYPTDRVVPMLPERLSTDLCSLRPDEDRYALTCSMEIDRAGEVVSHEIAESIIRSRHRLSYEEVQEFFDHARKRRDMSFADVGDDLLAALEVSRALGAARDRRGALDLDLPEAHVECDPYGEATGLRRRDRLDSHRLVEECMLAANEAVARHLSKLKLPGLYRVHDPPDPSSLERAAPGLALFGAHVPRNVQPTPEFYQPLVARMRKVDGGHIGQRLLLRTLMRAEYAPDCRDHFGLASKCYCHFTSPIRRYPDLLVHRVLKAWLRGHADDDAMDEVRERLAEIANQSNLMTDRATGIEMEALKIKAMEFMADQVGGVFEGWISGIMRRGFFVELVELPVEGLVDAQSIRGDTFLPDKDGVRFVGRHTGRTYPLGRRVRVRVVEVNVLQGEMDLELATPARRATPKSKKRRKKRT